MGDDLDNIPAGSTTHTHTQFYYTAVSEGPRTIPYFQECTQAFHSSRTVPGYTLWYDMAVVQKDMFLFNFLNHLESEMYTVCGALIIYLILRYTRVF